MYCRNCGHELGARAKFCKACGTQTMGRYDTQPKGSSPASHKIYLILGGIGAALVLVVMLVSTGSGSGVTEEGFAPLLTALKGADQGTGTSLINKSGINLDDPRSVVASTVVDILCDDGYEGSGGSGTIMDPDGIVLTNSHIIPQDNNENSTAISCVITLPDPRTGKIDEIYWAEPIIIPLVSNKYDLAFFQIGDPYVGNDGKTYGSYSHSFPSFSDIGCTNDDPRLGESVRVFGYPAISADGYYLTVTDGVISAIPNDGTIVTSAKVSSGNSGGLAVDENGCMVGVPAMISSGGGESLGIVLSNAIIQEFMNDYEAYLEISN